MIKKASLVAMAIFSSLLTIAQVRVSNGPNLENDADSKMNRMLGGDEYSFYCYRIRSKGKGTSYIIEKYDKKTLKPVFSKEFPVDNGKKTKIEDVQYAQDMVYIFIRSYDKDADKMSLYYITVSGDGKVTAKKEEVLEVKSDHFEFVDFEIYPNPGKTKFLVKSFHKANKEDSYQTDFILFDAKDMSIIWTKNVDEKVGGKSKQVTFSVFGGLGVSDNDIGFIGLYLDDKDNVYYASSYYAKNSNDKQKRYKASVSILESASQEPRTTELSFEDDYLVKDVEFSITPNGELVVGGFFKDVIERKGADLVKVGIFSFTINVANGEIVSKAIKIFDDKILTALESNPRRSKYFKYKLDYMIAVGSDVYYIGEQYSEEARTTSSSGYGAVSNVQYYYEYMDVIIAKLNSKGQFEWVKNTPLRNSVVLADLPHVFKQYVAVATDNAIYIINNEHRKNAEIYAKGDFEPKDLKTMVGIHGSNFVCTSISLATGKLKHEVIFENESYCFAPIQERNREFFPPSSTEIFVKGEGNDIYVYTEDRGKDRFIKLSFDK